MNTVSVYAFLDKDAGDGEFEGWTTQDFREAQEYARQYGFAIIELEYEYSDSSLIEDYRPGHALDGTPIEDEVEALPAFPVGALTCPSCNGQAEQNGAGGITCFFCGYDGPQAQPSA